MGGMSLVNKMSVFLFWKKILLFLDDFWDLTFDQLINSSHHMLLKIKMDDWQKIPKGLLVRDQLNANNKMRVVQLCL
jgi:hypothetical protein